MADVYVVIHLGTTFDESSAYRIPSELITLSWSVVEATTLENLPTQTILIKPEASTISTSCLSRYNVSWDEINEGLSFRDAISEFDRKLRDQVKGREFSFVTVDLQQLRVSLPREARDKGVVMPVYLQHPRVFDLRNEYLKWQATHPEAMSYPSSSLFNVITALDVSVPEGWSEDKQEDTKKATEVYSAILAQLAKKSIPLDAHKLVLTKPYDSAQDAKAFLAERSKILFLSNLPAETTQSELELWFAQYGGRPMAFWTLKNVDTDSKNNQNPNATRHKSICGFAVFSKHEDAAEALYLNGRVLIDRIVEVLASSTRILDRASELLTPFSSSKNRPRPGDWNCPSCGFSNFQRRIACFRCSFPATSAVAIQEQMYNGSQNNAHDPNMVRRHKQDDKQNSPINNGFNNDYYGGNGHHQLKTNNGVYNNTYSHNYQQAHNNGNNSRMHYNNSVPFRAGDWKCINEACHYHNFAKNLCCLKCGGAKPASVANQMQNSQSGNHSNHHNGTNQANIHNVNTTAAAIAAATASGQPLSLNGNYGGAQRSQTNRLPTQGQHSNQSPVSLQMNSNGLYSNLEQLQQLQFKQQLQNKPQASGHLPQHLAFLQASGLAALHNQRSRPKSSLPATSSPHHYDQQAGFQYKENSGNNGGVNMLSNHINSLSLNNTGM